MAWLGSGLWLFERTCGWARDSGFSRGHASAARIFAAPLVHSVKRLRCCVTPHAIGTAVSHGITNLIRTSDAAHSSAFETAPNGMIFAPNAGSNNPQNNPSRKITKHLCKSFKINNLSNKQNQHNMTKHHVKR
jgi:hypothetical protein